MDKQARWWRCLSFGLCWMWSFTFWLCGPASGFVIDETLTNNTPQDLTDDLQGAARWSNVSGSVLSNVRGLGEGLEYAIAPDFCAQIIPLFRDRQPPTCPQIQTEIQTALDHWGQNHPRLKFVNITPSLAARLPPQGTPEPWRGFGAEIDVFILSPETYPPVANFGAYTSFWYTHQTPIGVQGQPLPGKTLTSADIVFNNQSCYFLDTHNPVSGCNHFESLLIHEVGHALALDHPNEFPQRNFDTDTTPDNAIPINCQQPMQNLKLSHQIDPQAIMNSSLGAAALAQPQLSADDLGGRNFLYPICQASLTRRRLLSRPDPWQLFGILLVGSFISVFGIATLVHQWRRRRRRRRY